MILKGSTRAGANDLALHLSNAVDNERVIMGEMRGMIANNLYDGFREWELICDQTNAKEPFYSLSINPDPNQRDWSAEEWNRAIDRIEEKLGLSGQPRAIVFHEKEGSDGKIRKHAHVVWSRVKCENGKLKAIPMSHDYYKLKACAKELAKEFGLDLPRDIKTDTLPDKTKKWENYDHALSHGRGRDPESVQARKKRITKIWNDTKDAEEFCNAMRVAGYVVARGDRRSFVIVDRESGIHALARQIAGVNTKAMKARLGNADAYPGIEQARDETRIRAKDAPGITEDTSPKRIDLGKEQRLMNKLRRMAMRADQVSRARRAKLVKERKILAQQQKHEREGLVRKQRAKEAAILKQRQSDKPEGLSGNLRVIFGYEMIRKWKHVLEDRKRIKAFLKQQKELKQRHKLEAQRLMRKAKLLRKQAVRETQTLKRYGKRLGMGALHKRLSLQEQFTQKAQAASLSYT